MTRGVLWALLGMWLVFLPSPPVPALAQNVSPGAMSDEDVALKVQLLFVPAPHLRKEVLSALEKRGDLDVVPGLIQAMRFIPAHADILASLQALTGAVDVTTWHDWILWQEDYPEIEPFAGFDAFKAEVLANIDENFRLFLSAGVKHDIRLEEIVRGGVRKDGIPALVDPTHIGAAEATYLGDDDLVFGIEINGDARAYPLRILNWHEMFNDVVGGVPVALAYCTLCGSGILYETLVEGYSGPFIFGSSGFLYRSNKLMYDRQTHSLWNQFLGQPVVGSLTGSGLELKIRPVAITSWKEWRRRHPDTKVLSLDTGYERDYAPGQAYGAYFDSPDLMFPARVPGTRLRPKDFVFALRFGKHEKAWPLTAFKGGKVINDTVGDLDVVLIGDAVTRTVRAYHADGRDFSAVAVGLDKIEAEGKRWRVEEDALRGPDGEQLARLPGHIAYYFAWSGFKTGAPLYGD